MVKLTRGAVHSLRAYLAEVARLIPSLDLKLNPVLLLVLGIEDA